MLQLPCPLHVMVPSVKGAGCVAWQPGASVGDESPRVAPPGRKLRRHHVLLEVEPTVGASEPPRAPSCPPNQVALRVQHTAETMMERLFQLLSFTSVQRD